MVKGQFFYWILTNITSCSQVSLADFISIMHYKAQSSEDLHEPPSLGIWGGLGSLGKSL